MYLRLGSSPPFPHFLPDSQALDYFLVYILVYILAGLAFRRSLHQHFMLRFYPCHAIGPALVSCLSRGRLRGITVRAGSGAPPPVCARNTHREGDTGSCTDCTLDSPNETTPLEHCMTLSIKFYITAQRNTRPLPGYSNMKGSGQAAGTPFRLRNPC